MDKIMQPQDSCFTRDELKDYSIGRIAEPTATRIEKHLGSCEYCEETFVSLDSAEDTLISDIKSSPQEIVQGDGDSVLDDFLHRAKNLLVDSPHRMDDDSGLKTAIGDYELIDNVGRGGMGQVFRARHRRLEKEFAVKVLSGRRMQSFEAVSRFQREMKIVGQLDHPAIVQATDAGCTEETYYLTMEFVPGLNLSKILRSVSSLSVADACEMVRQAAEGIHYAHQQLVIHRDIKPSNLMLTPKGQIKILDLGLATLNNMNHAVDELTTVGQMMGTLDYMAPEQCEESRVDHRCDIYSLAATLYKLLTGRAPYSADDRHSPLQKLRAIAVEEFVPVTEHCSDLPSGLVELIHRCLSKDPSERIQTAEELQQALAPFCEDSNLPALLESANEFIDREKELEQPLVGLESKHEHQVQKEQKTSKSQNVAGNSSGWARWVVWMAAMAMLPLIWFGIQIIINWENGQLIIESDSPNVQVRLIKDGKPYKNLRVQQGANSTKIRAGKYEVQINDPSDQLVVENEQFILKRGKSIVARISNRKKTSGGGNELNNNLLSDSDGGGSAKSLQGISSMPTYKGKTIDYWYQSGSDESAKSFRRAVDKSTLNAWIRSKLAQCKREVSAHEICEKVKYLVAVCPDKAMAEEIMSFVGSVARRYNIAEQSDIYGRDMTIFDLPSIVGERFDQVTYDAIVKFLENEEIELNYFALHWLAKKARFPKDHSHRKKILEEVVSKTKHSKIKIFEIALQVLRKNFAAEPETQKIFSKLLPELQKPVKQAVCDSLAQHFPQTPGLAKHVVKGLKSTHGDEFFDYVGALQRLVTAENTEIKNLIQVLLSDSKWGWDSVGSITWSKNDLGGKIGMTSTGGSRRSLGDARGGAGAGAAVGGDFESGSDHNKRSKTPTNSTMSRSEWYGLHGQHPFKSTRQELLATEDTRRYLLLNSFIVTSCKPEILKSVFERELNSKYNDFYLDIVLKNLSAIDEPFSYNKFISYKVKFWISYLIANSDDKNSYERARNELSEFLVDQRGKTFANSRLDASVLQAFVQQLCGNAKLVPQDVQIKRNTAGFGDFVNLDSKQVERLKTTTRLLFGYKSFSKTVVDVLPNIQDSELPCLLWLCHFSGKNGTWKDLSSLTFSEKNAQIEIEKRTKKLESTLLNLRAVSLDSSSAVSKYQDLKPRKSDPDVIQDVLFILQHQYTKGAPVRGISANDLNILDRANRDEIAVVLDKIIRQERRVERPYGKRDMSDEAPKRAVLYKYIANRRNGFHTNGTIYDVNFWEGPLLKKRETKHNTRRLIKILKNVRFVDKDDSEMKKKVTSQLKSLIKNTTDEIYKFNLNQVLQRVEFSQEVATWLRAKSIEHTAGRFKKSIGKFPETVRDLMTKPGHIEKSNWKGPYLEKLVSEKDAWGSDYKFEVSEVKNKFSVISPGRDKKFGTSDDVRTDDSKWKDFVD